MDLVQLSQSAFLLALFTDSVPSVVRKFRPFGGHAMIITLDAWRALLRQQRDSRLIYYKTKMLASGKVSCYILLMRLKLFGA